MKRLDGKLKARVFDFDTIFKLLINLYSQFFYLVDNYMESSTNSPVKIINQTESKITNLTEMFKNLNERVNKLEIEMKSQKEIMDNLSANKTKSLNPRTNIEIIHF